MVRVLLGRERWENERFLALRSHHRFDSFTAGLVATAREKGGVSGIGRFRRHRLTPVPRVGSLAGLNEVTAAADGNHRIAARVETVDLCRRAG